MGHAEVAPYALLGAAALAVADHQHLVVAEPRHAAGHGFIVAKGTIPVNLAEIREDSLDKVHGVRPLGMARPLDSAPRRRNRLRLLGTPCCMFAHRYLGPQRPGQQTSRPRLRLKGDSTGHGRLGQIQLAPACHFQQIRRPSLTHFHKSAVTSPPYREVVILNAAKRSRKTCGCICSPHQCLHSSGQPPTEHMKSE